MNEARWLRTTRLRKLLGCLYNLDKYRRVGRSRKLSLFRCACCRRIWHLLDDERSRRAVEVAELAADSAVADSVVLAARSDAQCARLEAYYAAQYQVACTAIENSTPHHCADLAAGAVAHSAALYGSDLQAAFAVEQQAQIGLLREIVGNPFRSFTLVPSWGAWSDGIVLKLARMVFEERHLPSGTLDNSRMAVLADALEEAGCTNADILNHCRQPGEHVRGCWVIDLLLGKE